MEYWNDRIRKPGIQEFKKTGMQTDLSFPNLHTGWLNYCFEASVDVIKLFKKLWGGLGGEDLEFGHRVMVCVVSYQS
jgi:hypothetical protein